MASRRYGVFISCGDQPVRSAKPELPTGVSTGVMRKYLRLWESDEANSSAARRRLMRFDRRSARNRVCLCSELGSLLPYRLCDRIRLLAMDDPDSVPVGSLGTVGTVRFHDGWMQIDVQWDSGRTLMLSVRPDRVGLDLLGSEL